jgi:WD40 repeat protein
MTLERHTMNVTSVSFHSEGKWLVTGSEDGTIIIWDLRCVPSNLVSFQTMTRQRPETPILTERTTTRPQVGSLFC